MQSSDRVLAWRYGKALFEAAVAAGTEVKVQADLGGVFQLLTSSMPMLRHPRVAGADKKKLLEGAVGGKVAKTTQNFLELLIDKKRFELLGLIAADYAKLLAEKNSTAKAQVRTARVLSAESQQKLRERLKLFSGKNVELDVKEDPELIGGVVVRLGDWVLDSSLRGQLRTMKEAINGN
ncbi:MAG: ATP synthase F1 subunit delta [Elusimicrobiota bacterium]